MQIVIGLLFIVIYSAIVYYIGWNFKRWLVAMNVFKFKKLYWASFYFIAFSYIFTRLHESLHFLSVVGNYWLFVFQYGLFISIIVNILMLFKPFKNMKVMGSIAVVTLIVLFALGTYNAYTPTVKTATIEIDKKGEPLRVVLASDFHLGILSGKNHLQRFVDLANEQQPDVVLLAGDLVDDDPRWFSDHEMDEVLAQLETTYGVYGSLGNHEYYGGKIDVLVEEMAAANVRILMDETIEIAPNVFVTGQEDATNDKRKPITSLKPANDDAFWMVMNHTPDDLQSPADAKVDLHVSGHTHKGQMWPNSFITNAIFELDYGYKLKNEMYAFVSSGFGFWGPPTRIGTQSEIWVIDVKFKENE